MPSPWTGNAGQPTSTAGASHSRSSVDSLLPPQRRLFIAAASVPRERPETFSPPSPVLSNDGDSGTIMDYVLAVLAPVRGIHRAVTSKVAQRTLLNAFLVFTTSVILYGLAIFGYLLFYHNYLPDQVATVPVHLQYGYGAHPYGIASLGGTNLKDVQPYDISVTLYLPRSPPNLARGNFMVALHLLDGTATSDSPSSNGNNHKAGSPVKAASPSSLPITPFVRPDPAVQLADRNVLFSTTRPALMPYTDPVISAASRVMLLPYHVAFPREAETARLDIAMAERVEFPRRGPSAGGKTQRALPGDVLVEVQAGQDIQVYAAEVTLTARLSGLRWLMYHHRVISFVLMTTAFWAIEVAGLMVTWIILGILLACLSGRGGGRTAGGVEVHRPVPVGGGPAKVKVKGEPENMSDTERTFPSNSKQPPLKFERRIKQEDVSESAFSIPELPPAAEADDEDEEQDLDDAGAQSGFRDSGIGTSYSDHPDREKVRRRSGKGGQQGR